MQNQRIISDGSTIIHPDERLDDLQLGGLRILQKKQGFRFGMDAVLLSDFAQVHPRDRLADFGTGTGILPLLLHGRGKGASCEAFELQADMAEMAGRTMRLNGLQDKVHVHALPVERAGEVVARGSLDAIVCNPPYGLPGATLHNPSEVLSMARHQGGGGLDAWFRVAHLLLRGKGRLSLVFPAPQMLLLMNALQRAHLEPKRFRLVYPAPGKSANLVLIEAMKDARPMLHPEPPLVIYQDDGRETPELRRIYHLEEF